MEALDRWHNKTKGKINGKGMGSSINYIGNGLNLWTQIWALLIFFKDLFQQFRAFLIKFKFFDQFWAFLSIFDNLIEQFWAFLSIYRQISVFLSVLGTFENFWTKFYSIFWFKMPASLIFYWILAFLCNFWGFLRICEEISAFFTNFMSFQLPKIFDEAFVGH